MTNQIDCADVDSQFERRGGNHCADISSFHPLLECIAAGAGNRAVVDANRIFSENIAQSSTDGFRKSPRIDEDEGGAVFADQLGNALGGEAPIDLESQIGRLFRRALRDGWFEPDIDLLLVTQVDDVAGQRLAVAVEAGQVHGHFIHRLLCGGQADAGWALLRHMVESSQRKREMGASFVLDQMMDLINDHRFDGAEEGTAARRREHDVERFRRRVENVRRVVVDVVALFTR